MNAVEPRTFLLFGHGGYANRGCDAIVRSTTSMLAGAFPGARNVVASLRPETDANWGMTNVDGYVTPVRAPVVRFSRAWMRRSWAELSRRPTAVEAVNFEHLRSAARNAAACLSVGGDNYCYGPPHWLYAIDALLKRSGRCTVLWGASIEPTAIDSAMKRDLTSFDLICARESYTFEALQHAGLSSSVYLHPDPAFTMEPQPVRIPVDWDDRELLGLNLSPLVAKNERAPGLATRSAKRLIEHVLRATDLSVLLIPHVTWNHDDDMRVLSPLYREFVDTGRVALVAGDLTAPQYKSVIARCRLFIGARTHATIAAYSSRVPTLVIGYSIKARGIARDLFGNEELVIPIQTLEDEDQLTVAFDRLRERRGDVVATLTRAIPDVIRRSAAAVERVRALVT